MATPSAQMNLSGLARRLVNDGLLSDADAQKAQETADKKSWERFTKFLADTLKN